MKIYIIVATLVAYCYAAPANELLHPSPVNPSVVVAAKPEEKITIMTDPSEIAKYKKETKQPLYPTVLPDEHDHHIAKRDYKAEQEKRPQAPKPPTPENPLRKSFASSKPPASKRIRRNVETHIGSVELQKSQILPAILPIVSTTPITPNHEDHLTSGGFQKPQTLPFIFKGSNDDLPHQKREIPVLLVPKYKHPEESPKESSEKESQEDKKEKDANEDRQDHQKPQTLPSITKATTEDSQQKRDIPVPLVPKYQHPVESPKESTETKSHEDKKEISSEIYAVTVDDIQKPQTLPLILKETTQNTQQHKRDVAESSVPNQPEESLKENNKKGVNLEIPTFPQEKPQVLIANHDALKANEKVQNKEKKEVEYVSKPHIRDVHYLAQTLPTQNPHEHISTADLPKVTQQLPEHVKEHHVPISVQKPHTLKQSQEHDEEIRKEPKDIKKEEAKKISENIPNIPEVQVENLSDVKPYPKTNDHAHSIQKEHKQNILDDHLSAYSTTTSTTVHPAIRPRPVSVAELFARAHDN